MLQSRIESEAAAFEMQARVALDMEEVKDADQISPARAEARRLAAKRLAAEASLLCLGAQLLEGGGKNLETTAENVEQLERELSQGSTKTDLFPRAAELRAECLREVTLARRPKAQAAPESSESDELLTGISAAGKYMVYRDDRGIVVNLGQPLETKEGKLALSAFSREALSFLSGVAKAHKDYPIEIPETNRWADFVWPDWIPEHDRVLIQDFWSDKWGRGPREWAKDAAAPYNKAPTGTRVRTWVTVDGLRVVVAGRRLEQAPQGASKG